MEKIKFSITEIKSMVTIIYQINEVKSDELTNNSKYILEKLNSTVVEINGVNKRTFEINNTNNLIVISMWDNKYSVNGGKINGNNLEFSTSPMGVIYGKIETSSEEEYFTYSPSEERKVFLIDLESQKEVESTKITENRNEYFICKLEPGKKYLAIEYRHGSSRTVATGICRFEKVNGEYKAVMQSNEIRRVDYDQILDNIDKGNKILVPLEREIQREL